MNVIHKYTLAVSSSNLRDDAHHHSTEVLAAAALCRDLGTRLFRVKYAGDATTYPALLEDWRTIVEGKAAVRTWPADVSPRKVARLSLNHWLNDVCPVCTGRGYEAVRGAPTVMSDNVCKACGGTAKRAVEAKHNLIHLVEDMVEVLNAMSAHAAGKTMKRLASEMEL
ncbi:hypothetical protein HHL21_12080 [Massilia sp. RP-1-19]|uniref:Uncharacterized protein n=1 Tax=Massilia polaris TaxID=2728846 RepID=A0A848HK70_9BURK|nr:hypothetical protein [Massilia polaris]NML61805.1 hypothetical protein [Massilia polaris]